jgi:hypothetical protein
MTDDRERPPEEDAAGDRRDLRRRQFNIMEGAILAALIGMGAMVFSMRDSVITLRVEQESTNRLLLDMRSQLADIPSLTQRVSRNEVKIESMQEEQKEAREMRALK